MIADGPDHLVAQGVKVGPAVVIDNAFGVARGAGGVVERDRLPLICRPLPRVVRVALGQQRLVIQCADRLAFAVLRVIHVDDQRWMIKHGHGSMDHGMEFTVGNQHPGFAVGQHEGNGFGVEAYVKCIEHCAEHGHRKVGFEHGRDIGQHHRHGIALANPASGQRTGQTPAALVSLQPGAANRAVDHGGVVRVDTGCAFDKAQRRQGNMVDSIGLKALLKNRHEGLPVADC